MLHEPEYHILYNMYLELSMSTALNYYAAEFNRLWSKIINLQRDFGFKDLKKNALREICDSGTVGHFLNFRVRIFEK